MATSKEKEENIVAMTLVLQTNEQAQGMPDIAMKLLIITDFRYKLFISIVFSEQLMQMHINILVRIYTNVY